MKRASLVNELLDTAASLLDKFQGKQTPCVGGEQSGFYPFPSNPAEVEQSKRVCRKCPFRRECLQYGAENYETGIWGGYYLCDGQVRKGHSPFLGKRSVRTQCEEEMFAEDFIPIPLNYLDAFNNGTWNPKEWYDQWGRENGILSDDEEWDFGDDEDDEYEEYDEHHEDEDDDDLADDEDDEWIDISDDDVDEHDYDDDKQIA